jgi:hypothetical protein
MPLPRVRITVRRLMVAVVVVGIILGSIAQVLRLRRFARAHEAKAAEIRIAMKARSINAETAGNTEEAIRRMASEYPAQANSLLPGASKYQRSREAHKRKVDYYERLLEKYSRAARHPWLTVSPDPPEPE